ncbi:hypothetical protein [Streptomyces sp. NPDC057694]|uniref:hypothetical protein n=1 Tax=Streptomyces sp. NPDC057694 TaxID=3346216 RepID=UPI00369D428A
MFQLYWEAENPKLPPPVFTCFRDGHYTCGFHMYMHTWSHEVSGSHPELISTGIKTAGIPIETDQDTAHYKSLALIEEQFRRSPPMEPVLHGRLPAALVAGQTETA